MLFRSTSRGGDYFAIGVGGAVTGKGADILIIDDPHSEQEAAMAAVNPDVYDKVYEWYTSGPRQRLQPGGAIVIVMTRWSLRDLTAQVLKAAAQLKSLLCERAAEMLGAPKDKIILKKGRLSVDQPGGRWLSLAALAKAAAAKKLSLETESYHAEHETPPEGVFAACVAEVAVDLSTGLVKLRKLDTIHDVATILNPVGHQGQIDGGIAQGLGQALMERIVYGKDGQLLTGSLMDYQLPRAADFPSIDFVSCPPPAPSNPWGVKGCGEAGCAAAPPAVVNAVIDALQPYGVRHIDMPLTPEKVWRAMQGAR